MGDTIFLGMSLKDWAWFLGGLITLISLINGLRSYVRENRIKRAEFLEKLISEFNEHNKFLAKRILDDFWILTEGPVELAEKSDEWLIKEGSVEKKEKSELNNLVKDLLRDHGDKSVTNESEQRARQSFDDLLDFFVKLDYYLSLRLITRDELMYFYYYFQRCAFKSEGAVMQYASTYGYPSLFRLLFVLNIKPKNRKLFDENLQFNNYKQEKYYSRLRHRNPIVNRRAKNPAASSIAGPAS